MLKLLKAVRKTAIKDQKDFNSKGFRKGKDAWQEWKESKCRFIYYHSNCLICKMIDDRLMLEDKSALGFKEKSDW